MGLQIRLRHALGERVLELDPRTVDDPLVLGRAAEADVQVPSVNVGARHAVVFIHEGHWVVQDTSASHPTYVNGEALQGPRALYSGDVIVLGTDANAPMIEVDPDGAALGSTGQGDAAATAALPAGGGGGYQGQHPVDAAPAHAYPPPSRMVATGTPVPPAGAYAERAPDPAAHDPEPDGDGDHAEWAAAAAGGRRSSYARRKSGSNDAAIGVAMVGAVAIISLVGFVIYQRREQPAPVVARVAPKRAPVVEVAPKNVPKSIFSDDGAPGRLPPGSVPPRTGSDRRQDTANLKKPPPPPDVTDDQPPATADEDDKPTRRGAEDAAGGGKGAGAAGEDAAGEGASGGGAAAKPPKDGQGEAVISATDPTFRVVENAYYSPDHAKALLTFAAYEEEFPDKHKETIAQYREEMLDKVWWDRIESLFEKRRELTQSIKETQLSIKEETEEAHKKTVLEPRLDEQKSRLSRLGDKLTKEMGYRLPTPPPIVDEAAMAELRAKRDKALYEPWKKRVLKHIRATHGDFPWAGEK